MTIEPILPFKTTQKIKRRTGCLNFSLNLANAVMLDADLKLEPENRACQADERRFAISKKGNEMARRGTFSEGQRFISC